MLRQADMKYRFKDLSWQGSPLLQQCSFLSSLITLSSAAFPLQNPSDIPRRHTWPSKLSQKNLCWGLRGDPNRVSPRLGPIVRWMWSVFPFATWISVMTVLCLPLYYQQEQVWFLPTKEPKFVQIWDDYKASWPWGSLVSLHYLSLRWLNTP